MHAMGLKRTKHTYIYVLHHTQARLKNSLKVWALTDKFMLVYATIPMNNYEAKISECYCLCALLALWPLKLFRWCLSAALVSSR